MLSNLSMIPEDLFKIKYKFWAIELWAIKLIFSLLPQFYEYSRFVIFAFMELRNLIFQKPEKFSRSTLIDKFEKYINLILIFIIV